MLGKKAIVEIRDDNIAGVVFDTYARMFVALIVGHDTDGKLRFARVPVGPSYWRLNTAPIFWGSKITIAWDYHSYVTEVLEEGSNEEFDNVNAPFYAVFSRPKENFLTLARELAQGGGDIDPLDEWVIVALQPPAPITSKGDVVKTLGMCNRGDVLFWNAPRQSVYGYSRRHVKAHENMADAWKWAMRCGPGRLTAAISPRKLWLLRGEEREEYKK
jgi:hypothetical protein